MGELRGDRIEVPGAIQGQEEDVFLGEGDVELVRMGGEPRRQIGARGHRRDR